MALQRRQMVLKGLGMDRVSRLCLPRLAATSPPRNEEALRSQVVAARAARSEVAQCPVLQRVALHASRQTARQQTLGTFAYGSMKQLCLKMQQGLAEHELKWPAAMVSWSISPRLAMTISRPTLSVLGSIAAEGYRFQIAVVKRDPRPRRLA